MAAKKKSVAKPDFTKTTITQPGAAENTIITAPEKFGLPNDQRPIDLAPQQEVPAEVFPETAPRVITGAPVAPRGKSGMTVAKEQAIANRKMEDISLERRDAFQFVINALKPYGLDGVGQTLNELMIDPTIGPAKAEYIIKYDTTINPKTGKPFNDAYAKRFAGNFRRIEQGLPAYSEGEYMAYENQYKSLLNSLGYGNLATKSAMENWIANTVSPNEIASRVELATTVSIPVQQTLQSFLPSIGTNDIVAALLDTSNGLPVLKQKVERAKIATAAKTAGLPTISEARAEQLLQANVTEAEAQRGYMNIASGIERGRQLAALQGEGDFTVGEAESAVFGLAGAPEAGKKMKRLASRERVLYEGQSGLTAGALDTGRAGAI